MELCQSQILRPGAGNDWGRGTCVVPCAFCDGKENLQRVNVGDLTVVVRDCWLASTLR